MSLHPKPAHWFETYVPRDQTVYALETLAATGQVELDRDIVSAPLLNTRELRQTVDEIERLGARYSGFLPAPDARHLTVNEEPEAIARVALACLRNGLARQLRLGRRLKSRERELRNLDLLRECLELMGDEADALIGFGHRSEFLEKRILACPPSETEDAEEADGVSHIYRGRSSEFHVIVCLPEGREALELLARWRHCEELELPAWLVGNWSGRVARIADRMAGLVDQVQSLKSELQTNRTEPRLSAALDEAAALRWYLDHTFTLTADRRYCHVTGWTTADKPELLQQALRRARIDAVLLFRPDYLSRPPPVSISRSRWTRPFRLFVNMLGTPGPAEFDPAGLLSFMVPVLFGLMFPDVGHGLVIAVLGLVFSRRYPTLSFLVPCGLAAAGFGVLFGETFGSHQVIPALWHYPLDRPELVLLASLGLGAGINLLGLALSGLEAHWRGELRQWLWLDGAVLLLYVSALAGVFLRQAWFLTGLATGLYVIGLFATCDGAYRGCLLRGLGRLLMSAVELALNTLSFLRVGAFAIAHAALSKTLIGLTGMIETPALQILALVLGHGLIILVEGLVVFVQTTRLILFEFFIRFLRAEGRLFRPLAARRKTPQSDADREARP